jgi:ABC-type branched-subunit amino acid transport system ATPase component
VLNEKNLIGESVVSVIKEINKTEVAIFLVEQSIEVVMELATSIFLMSKGEVVFKSSVEEFKNRPEIRERYLEV